MVKLESPLGLTGISQEYFANLVGHVASECFGVAGLSETNPTRGLRSKLLHRDLQDKGVRVRIVGERLAIDLHIIVMYGVNIAAIVKSIVNKVRYTVEQATGLEVANVNVYVDSMKTE